MASSKKRRGPIQPSETDSDSSADIQSDEPVLEDSEDENSPDEVGPDDEDVESIIESDNAPSNEDESNKESDDAQDDEEEEKPDGNAGWADAMSKVLRTNKPKKKKTLVLSRAKKLSEVGAKEEPEDPGFEVDGEEPKVKADEEEDIKPDIKPVLTSAELKEHKKKRKFWETMNRRRPDILAKDREKVLANVATKGVIQLFNAVRKQQKEIDAELEEAGASERKRDKVLKSVDKNSFLDILMGPTKSVHVGRTVQKKEPKNEDESEKAPIWSVLRDDFMMGDGKLKDWDKAVDNGDSDGEVESIGDDDDSS